MPSKKDPRQLPYREIHRYTRHLSLLPNQKRMTIKKHIPSRAEHVKSDYSDQVFKLALWSNIYHLRKRKGLSQTAFAKEAKVTQAIISEIESGDYNPSMDMLSKLTSVLKVDIWTLTKQHIKWKMLETAGYLMTKIENLDILKIMKLLYLSDYEWSQKNNGQKLTELNYIRRNRWPFDKDIYQLDNVFLSQENTYQSPAIKKYNELQKNEQAFLDIIIEKYGHMSSSEIMRYTYTTQPMSWCTIGGDERMWEVIL